MLKRRFAPGADGPGTLQKAAVWLTVGLLLFVATGAAAQLHRAQDRHVGVLSHNDNCPICHSIASVGSGLAPAAIEVAPFAPRPAGLIAPAPQVFAGRFVGAISARGPPA